MSAGGAVSSSTDARRALTKKASPDKSAHYCTAWASLPMKYLPPPVYPTKYASVMTAFDAFFKVRRNVILERAKFNRRNQRAGESAEQYIIELYHLVETCEYKADIVGEMLRDRLVVSMRDTALAERLQLDAELTLDKTKKAMRQKEAVREQNLQLLGEEKHKIIPLDSVKAGRSPTEKGRRPDRRFDRRPNRAQRGAANLLQADYEAEVYTM